MVEAKKKLAAKHGEKCFEPLTEEEIAKKSKSEFLPMYLKGKEYTDEFQDFYYNNDIQEQIWKQIKEKTANQHKEEMAAFERDFPALCPEKSPPKSAVDNSVWQVNKINNEKLSILERSFPTLDKRIIEYVLYNFSYQLPEAMNYLKALYPSTYVNIMPAKEAERSLKPQITVLPTTKPKPFQMRQHYKKKDKSQYENPIPNIIRQSEANPAAKYSEIRRDADTYLKTMRIYLKNEAFAHAAGQHSEAGRYKKLAEEYYNLYNEAKHQAMFETISQRLVFRYKYFLQELLQQSVGEN
eukprot:TRINITY_DN70941_c0_g1_i1.p3 TRINITY_DN70941_c0_g1~~TRINITY_DN70941_c0_g1_i1.p3  ORF type:complete len:297 (+),score=43.26 TRINITY_DN70941_c0_g1_i1:750-1640(+)